MRLEVPEVLSKNSEVTGPFPSCITLHPGFSAVCLDRWVLQTALYQYRQQYSECYDGPEHKLNRHIAYRQLVRWCWSIIGKEIRVVLPSRAVSCIRAHINYKINLASMARKSFTREKSWQYVDGFWQVSITAICSAILILTAILPRPLANGHAGGPEAFVIHIRR